MASALLFTYGFVTLLLTINALRRVGHPNSPLKPLWLPAMITSSLPVFFLLSRLAVGAVFFWVGGTRLEMGRVGMWMLAISIFGLLVIIARNHRSVRAMKPSVGVPVFEESLPTLLTGRPIPTPPDIDEVTISGDWGGFDLISSRTRPTVPAPMFVYVHGGGWTGGGPQKQARRMYHMLAREGWVVAAVRYPFAPAASIPDQVISVKRAIHELKSNAEAYGADPARLILSGSSAGAHLAAMAALTNGEYQPGFEGVDVSVSACIPMYGIYDMVNRNQTRPPWPYIDRDVMKGSYADRPEAFHAASPLDLISEAAPPFLVVHGTHDSLVPLPEAQIFVTALIDAGVPVEFIEILGAQHGFDAVSSNVSRHVGALVTTWATNHLSEMTISRES